MWAASGFQGVKETIILMGPIGVGKSTQAELLSKELGQPRCSYDEVKADYRKRIGFSSETAQSINDEHGLYAMLAYMNEFKSQILEPIINDYRGHIIDLGGGAQCFDEPHQVERVRQVFEKISEIFLLLPSQDLATNITSLPGLKENYPINAYLIMHPTNELFAKKTVYTLGKKPEETMRDIIFLLGNPSKKIQLD
jgi:shikimate kinase